MIEPGVSLSARWRSLLSAVLLLALAFQLFIFSRHPYYLDLMQAALKGELAPEPEKNHNRD